MTTTAEPVVAGDQESGPSQRGAVLRVSRENTLLAVLIVFALVVAAIEPRFLNWDNINLVLASAAVLGIVALGEFIVVVSGAIDISIGAIVAVGAAVASLFLEAGLPVAVVVVLSLAVTALTGSVNGLLVGVAGLPSVVVTLATLSLIRGMLSLTLGGRPLGGGQASLGWLWDPWLLDIRPSVLVLLGAALVAGAFVRFTQLGRNIFSVGSNEAASRITGVRVGRTRVLTFAVSGLAAGVAGLMIVGQRTSIEVGTVGYGFEFLAIGAVVLGGTDIFGGSGRVRGVMVGVVMLFAVYNAMVLASIPAAWQSAVVGSLILTAVIIDTQRSRSGRRASEP